MGGRVGAVRKWVMGSAGGGGGGRYFKYDIGAKILKQEVDHGKAFLEPPKTLRGDLCSSPRDL